LPHPPHSPEFTPSYFHLFGPIKNTLRGRSLGMMTKLSREWKCGSDRSNKTSPRDKGLCFQMVNNRRKRWRLRSK